MRFCSWPGKRAAIEGVGISEGTAGRDHHGMSDSLNSRKAGPGCQGTRMPEIPTLLVLMCEGCSVSLPHLLW